MKKINVINEFDLLSFSRCPLFLARIEIREPADTAAVNAAADDLLGWITRETFEHAIPDLSVVRRRAEAFFRKRYTGPMTFPIAKRLIRMSRRLHDLVFYNNVLYPTSSYQLEFGVARIEGSITLVQSKSKLSLPPRIIRLRNHTIKPPVIPDIVSLARWLYGIRESGFPQCAVYSFSLTGKTACSEEFTESIAQSWLSAAVGNWAGSKLYPSPGRPL